MECLVQSELMQPADTKLKPARGIINYGHKHRDKSIKAELILYILAEIHVSTRAAESWKYPLAFHIFTAEYSSFTFCTHAL